MQRLSHAETVGLTVRLPRQTHEAARVEAARKNVSLNVLVAQALEQVTQTKPKGRKQPA
jgi:predicted HicB family RNase H-like nuclease